jgi:hypothetical protein
LAVPNETPDASRENEALIAGVDAAPIDKRFKPIFKFLKKLTLTPIPISELLKLQWRLKVERVSHGAIFVQT